ncbi:MAG: methylated-DNA--[protein]-cysteine S-methyltransferase [Alphaproteobacteria bacterium]
MSARATITRLSLTSPVGDLTITAEDTADGQVLTRLDWGYAADSRESPILSDARDQLNDYFAGRRHAFDLVLRPAGSAFRQAVWRTLGTIGWGQTRTYGQVAAALATAARAVGGACGANPLPIFIPCHRVLGADGALHGYSGEGGLATKAWLLQHEGAAWLDQPGLALTGGGRFTGEHHIRGAQT